MKRADHPLTAALTQTLPSGEVHIPKILVRLSGGIVRWRRPKWIARWEGWYVYDTGWMSLSDDRAAGWQTEERARQKAQERAREDARWDAAIASVKGGA